MITSKLLSSKNKSVSTKMTMRSLRELLKETWSSYNRQFTLLIGLSIIINGSSIIGLIFNQIYLSTTAGAVVTVHSVLNLASLVASVWGSLALYAAICFPDRIVTIKQAFKIGGPFFLNSLTTSVLTFLWIMLGFILLILPGIFWGILYSLAVFVVFKEGLNNRAALERSKQLVRPFWLSVMGRQLGLVLVVGIPLTIVLFILAYSLNHLPDQFSLLMNDLVGLVINVLLFPISLLFLSAIYRNLVSLHQRQTNG